MREAQRTGWPQPVARRRPTRVAAAAAEPKLRTWRDASGQFEIEAAMVSARDGKVTLKKKDGREITVPVEKLSKRDQAYLEEQSQAAAKPENPFD